MLNNMRQHDQVERPIADVFPGKVIRDYRKIEVRRCNMCVIDTRFKSDSIETKFLRG